MIKQIFHPSKFIFCFSSLLSISTCYAEEHPLWELGVGVGAITLPDYRGSDESHTYVLPVPYFVYRGEHLKADRNGVRGMLYDSDKVDLNISISGTIPVHSKDNAARRGMADLKPAIEVGPTQARWVPVAVQIAPQAAQALGAGAHPMSFRIALVEGGRSGAELSERSTFVVPR